MFVSINEELTTGDNKRAVYTDETTNWITAYVKFKLILCFNSYVYSV